MIRKNFYLTEQQVELLELLEKETGLTMSEHIRRALDEYLAKRTKRGQDASQKNPI